MGAAQQLNTERKGEVEREGGKGISTKKHPSAFFPILSPFVSTSSHSPSFSLHLSLFTPVLVPNSLDPPGTLIHSTASFTHFLFYVNWYTHPQRDTEPVSKISLLQTHTQISLSSLLFLMLGNQTLVKWLMHFKRGSTSLKQSVLASCRAAILVKHAPRCSHAASIQTCFYRRPQHPTATVKSSLLYHVEVIMGKSPMRIKVNNLSDGSENHNSHSFY